ncbi:hypothetical protein LS81_010930 [Helicobacter trogontum]|uniref:Uncharacterized protein n=1 Tax=Helicobacter trogontum TaxID=50960 RepID=A0A099VCP3_9HELI|nr:hypothetical protein [Helicobacter trogontum]TLD79015.1 hypothetical protein LS81_010930 [Helicobacter trogontum]
MKKLVLIIGVAFYFCAESFANNIEIKCNKSMTCGDDYECNIEKCLIKNAKNLKEALLYDIRREVEEKKTYSPSKSMAYEAMLQLDLFNGQKAYDVSVKVDRSIDKCRLGDCIEAYGLTIEKMDENEVKLKYQFFSEIYEKTYKKTKDGIEVITENYI